MHLSKLTPIEGEGTQLRCPYRTECGDLLRFGMAEQALTIHLSESDKFRVAFQLTGLPIAGYFVDRDAEIAEIEEHLLATKA